MLIKGYEEGSDITVLDVQYTNKRRNNSGKYDNDFLTVLFRDNVTGEKKLEFIEEPIYTFYKANDDVYIDSELMFIEKEKVHPVDVKYNSLLKKIAEDTDNLDFFYDNINNGRRGDNRRLHTVNGIFNSDMDIREHFRYKFGKFYTNNSFNISKAYFDIEVDGINQRGDFPEMGECPINAITYINANTNDVFTLLLRNPENPLIEEFERNLSEDTFRRLKYFIINHVGGVEKAKYHKIYDYNFNMLFYDNEIDLIKDFFNLVNIKSPDFLLAWNMAFDIPYIVERIKELNYIPEDIMCPSYIPEKYRKVMYYIDQDHKNEPEEKGDYYFISGKTNYQDQLVHFASKRKGQSKFPGYKLDMIGEIVAKVNKLDYSHITTQIAKLPYKNYEVFVFYNIMDTIVQACIENKVRDMDYVFNKCLVNATRYNKCHRQSVYLKNRGIIEFEKQGFIAGNNNNVFNSKPTEKFPGALVGNPLNNSDFSKQTLFGVPINIIRNLLDYDYKSLYPSILREFNIAPNTQIGIINIANKVWQGENPFGYEKYFRGGQFIEDFKSGVYLEFCERWLHLAGYQDFINDMEEFFNIYRTGLTLDPTNNTIPAMYKVDKDYTITPFYKEESTKPEPAMIYYTPRRSFDEEIRKIRETAQMDLYDLEKIARRKISEKEEEEEYNFVS